MTPRADLNKRAIIVHEANKSKGFHDKEWSNEHLLCLVISELMEAVEAHRQGKRANVSDFILLNNASILRTKNPEYFNTVSFCSKIKDSVEDELADAVIRLLDMAGLRGCLISRCANTTEEDVFGINFETMSFPEKVFVITSNIANSSQNINFSISPIIESINVLCDTLSIDLWKHVELKMKYNQTRPALHGKKY